MFTTFTAKVKDTTVNWVYKKSRPHSGKTEWFELDGSEYRLVYVDETLAIRVDKCVEKRVEEGVVIRDFKMCHYCLDADSVYPKLIEKHSENAFLYANKWLDAHSDKHLIFTAKEEVDDVLVAA